MQFSCSLLKYQVLNLKIGILSIIYGPLNGDMKQRETHFKDIFSKNGISLKNIVLARDFNINLLDFETKTCKTF